MKNNRILLNAVIVIIFAVFNVIMFQVPVERTDSYWWVYGFTCVAFLVQLYVCNVTLAGDEEVRSKFLGYPIAYVTGEYFLVQLILCAYIVGNSDIARWKVIILNTIVLGFALISICSTQAGKNYINSVDEQVMPKVAYIKDTLAELELMAADLTEDDEKKAMNKLLDVVRYSDPMSSPKLQALEEEIYVVVTRLGNSDSKKADIDRLIKLFGERNAKCKVLK